MLCGPTALLAESVNPLLPEATGQKSSHCEGKDDPEAEVPPQGVENTTSRRHTWAHTLMYCPVPGAIRSKDDRKNGTQFLLSRNSHSLGKVWLTFLQWDEDQAPPLPRAVGWG